MGDRGRAGSSKRDDADGLPRNIDLLLSGGGYRATLFHLGVLRFLYEYSDVPEGASLLARVGRVISVSGGSITAAHFAANFKDYISNFELASKELIDLVTSVDLRRPALRHETPISQLLRDSLGLGIKFSDLSEGPSLEILATHVQTGGCIACTREGIIHYNYPEGDTHVPENGTRRALLERDRVKSGEVLISAAVAASSAFPPVLPPVSIDEMFKKADPKVTYPLRSSTFADGGIRDNLGAEYYSLSCHPIDRQRICIVSSAGQPFQWIADALKDQTWKNWLERLSVTASIQMERLLQTDLGRFPHRLVSLTDAATLPLNADSALALHAQGVTRPIGMIAASIPTDLSPISAAHAYTLMRLGYELAAVQFSKRERGLHRSQLKKAAVTFPDQEFWKNHFPSGVERLNAEPHREDDDRSLESMLQLRQPVLHEGPGDILPQVPGWRRIAVSSMAVVLLGVAIFALTWPKSTNQASSDPSPAPPQEQPMAVLEPFEPLGNYIDRIAEKDVQSSLQEGIKANQLDPVEMNKRHVDGELKDYHYSWIIAPGVSVGLVEFRLEGFKGRLVPPTKSSDSSLARDFYFKEDPVTRKLVPQTVDIEEPSRVDLRAVKLAIYAEHIWSGNFLLMTINRANHCEKFSFDVSIPAAELSHPGPFLHEVRIVDGATTMADQAPMVPLKMTQAEGLGKRAVSLLEEVRDAMDAAPAVRDAWSERLKRGMRGTQTNARTLPELLDNTAEWIVKQKGQKYASFTPTTAAEELARIRSVVFLYYKLRDAGIDANQ